MICHGVCEIVVEVCEMIVVGIYNKRKCGMKICGVYFRHLTVRRTCVSHEGEILFYIVFDHPHFRIQTLQKMLSVGGVANGEWMVERGGCGKLVLMVGF